MEPLTDDEIRLIECLEPQVTQGPWKHQRIGHRVVTVDECEADCVCVAPSEIHFPCSAEYWEANAQFIVQARHMLPRAIEEIKATRQQLADVTAERERLRAALNDASGMAVALGNDRDKLRDRLADYEAAVGNIMAEPCDASERHCTCVPALRIEVEKLRAELLQRDMQKEPDDEWLRASFGEPTEKNGGVYIEWRPQMIVFDTKFNNTFRISEHSGYIPGRLETRAAVLAAVAETKGES